MGKSYDSTIGYSPLERADPGKLQQLVQIVKNILDPYIRLTQDDSVLVAGAGTGLEAALVHAVFKARTVGVDLNIVADSLHRFAGDLVLLRQDLTCLGLPNRTFEFVYCYHVLEHVKDPVRVLKELHRVLSPGGVLFIGFPNRNRLFAYAGTSQRASIVDKIKWNFRDYAYRMQFKFRNEYGAHAGFTDREFRALASMLFENIRSVRTGYMLAKYAKRHVLIKTIALLRLDEFLFPSNYYVCVKEHHES